MRRVTRNVTLNLHKYLFTILIVWVGITSIWLASYYPKRINSPKKKSHNLKTIGAHNLADEKWENLTSAEEDFMNDYVMPIYDRIKNEPKIRNHLRRILPELGDLGKPAYLKGHHAFLLTKSLRMKALNALLSNKMPLNRRLPDVRYPVCQNISYDTQNLPRASVVLVFHNEHCTLIMRTLHSLERETPPQLLEEIILIDDNSKIEDLKGTLRHYIRSRVLKKTTVQLISFRTRKGIVKSRLEAAKHASGGAIVFLDAYTEVTKGWLEPMLLRIKEKRDAVVTPIIDTISPTTFEYQPQVGKTIIGGFTWDGEAIWVDVPKRLMHTQGTSIAPIATPTMVGGIFAVDRKYFWEFGSYDEKMNDWGGENLEMSFRTWQCGGSIEVIPCSRVGHIFTGYLPYTYKLPNNQSAELINLARTVNVWMDDYSRLFYLYNEKVELGDIQDRLKLREKLKCKSFKWYLENIYPEKFVPDENVTAYGRVRLTTNNLCLDTSKRHTERKFDKLKVAECKKEFARVQFFSLTNSGLLRTELRCASIVDVSKVQMNNCDSLLDLMKWKLLEDGSLVHLNSGLCLDATDLKPGQDITVNSCNGSPGQTWKFDFYSVT